MSTCSDPWFLASERALWSEAPELHRRPSLLITGTYLSSRLVNEIAIQECLLSFIPRCEFVRTYQERRMHLGLLRLQNMHSKASKVNDLLAGVGAQFDEHKSAIKSHLLQDPIDSDGTTQNLLQFDRNEVSFACR